jgi:uncharacterized membrane protein YqhA
MKSLLLASRWMVLIAVLGALAAAVVAFTAGAVRTVTAVQALVTVGAVPGTAVGLVQVMDVFLIGAALLLFAVGIYELFITPVAVPEALRVSTLDELKAKLAGVIVLVIAGYFLEHLVAADSGQDVLYRGCAAALVSGTLVAFLRFGLQRQA